MDNPAIVQICHGKIYPPYISAYALRANNLLKGYNTTIVSTGGMVIRDNFTNSIREYRSMLTTIYSVVKGNRYLEIAISRGKFLRKKYVESVKSIIAGSDIVILEGPWQYYLFRGDLKGKYIVYDAHNAESLLRKTNKYYEYALQLEKDLVTASNLILTVSSQDMDYFIKSFNAKNIFIATPMNVIFCPEVCLSYCSILDMPPGPSLSPGGFPVRLSRFHFFPQGKILRIFFFFPDCAPGI